jgi:hypothetical protein
LKMNRRKPAKSLWERTKRPDLQTMCLSWCSSTSLWWSL